MITYEPFWVTLKEKQLSTYYLNKEYGLSNSTINRLRNDLPLSTATLDRLCTILECSLSEIAVYKNQ